MLDVIGARDYLAKQGNAFWHCQVNVTQSVQAFSAPASTTRSAPPPYLAGVPRPSERSEAIRFATTTQVTCWQQPLYQYVDWLWKQVPIQEVQEEESKRNEKVKETVHELIILVVILALPELAPEIGWIGRTLTLGGIAETVVTGGAVQAVVEECVGFMVGKGYDMFADISTGIVKKVIVNLTKSEGFRKDATEELTAFALKKGTFAIKEAFYPESRGPAVPALKALERVHYFLMEADPTYPKRYADYQAQLAEKRTANLHAVTTYLSGPR